jgi:hypothetical protein
MGSTVKLSRATELAVVGCWPFEQNKSGFALPLFAHPDNFAMKLVQDIDQISGKVSGFRVLEDADLALVAVSNVAQSAVGEDIIYAFLNDDGNAYAGTSLQLADLLRKFAKRNPTRQSTNLQIIELIGTNHEKKVARVNMRQTIVQQAGANAAASFYGGALRSILWSVLVGGAQNEEIAKRILKVRSQLNASIENGVLIFDLNAISSEDRATIDENDLEAKILAEFELMPTNGLPHRGTVESESHDVEAVQKKVAELLKRIKRSGRQEERIAILMDAIIADRSIGLTALLQYGQDRAKFANWTLDQLRGRFFQTPPKDNHLELFQTDNQIEFEIESSIALLVPRLFTQHYPLSRGELLYYLAKHLAKWPRVNVAIKRSLDRTASMFVDYWRPLIDELLSAHNGSN